MTREEFAARVLAERRSAGLERRLRCIDGPQDTWVDVDGRRALLLCSNNYLGLANHPTLREAAARAARDYGVGAGASRLVSGSMRLHHRLEERLAAWKGADAALLFNSGYHANLGAIAALVGEGDAVFSDALNHASIVDGCRLSRARVVVYEHANPAALEEALTRTPARRRLIVTDSVFSMDGDVAPLAALCDVAEAHGVMILVDEAHATGVLGPHGGGVVEAEGLRDRVTVQMGTLGKALGCFGAFVAGRRQIVELLLNVARSFVYTTALPPPVVAAALEAVEIVTTEPQRRTRLADNAAVLHGGLAHLGLRIPAVPSHILPILVGSPERAVNMANSLLARELFVQAIRPPTVPAGTSRLRVSLTSEHTAADLEHALRAFAEVLPESVS